MVEDKFKIYICGKMSGIEDYNRPKFNETAETWMSMGFDVFNPATIIGNNDWEWDDYMREAIKGMMSCSEVYVLKGYEKSKGANIEIDLAKKLDMSIVYES